MQNYPLTDVGNARRLIHRFTPENGHPEIMYVPGHGWYVWNEDRWIQSDSLVMQLAIATIESIENPESAKDLDQHIQASQSAYRLKAMLEVASHLPGIEVSAEDLDKDPFLFGLPYGVLDLRTGQPSPPHPGDRITQAADAEHDADATAPRFLAFLEEVLPDLEVRAFLQRAVGYSLTGSVSEEVIFLLVGKGANGKSTLVNTLRRILGTYARPIQTSLLTSRHSGGHETDKLALQGIRFAAANETDFGDRIAEGKVKSLVSTEAITARGAYQRHAATFNPTHHLWLSTNYLPNIDGSDDGLARRLIVIEFPRTFSPTERDRTLTDALLAESSGILNWMIEGTATYLRDGLNPPASVQAAAEEYRDSMDTFSHFVTEYLEFDPAFSATNAEVWEAYSKFQATEPAHLRLGRKSFSQAMLRKFKQVNQQGVRRWPGLQVKHDDLDALIRNATGHGV